MQIKIFFLKLFFSKKEFDTYKVVLEVALFLVEQKIAEAKKWKNKFDLRPLCITFCFYL